MLKNYNLKTTATTTKTVQVLGGKYVKPACWLTWKNRLQREVQLTVAGRRGDVFLQHVQEVICFRINFDEFHREIDAEIRRKTEYSPIKGTFTFLNRRGGNGIFLFQWYFKCC